MNYTKVNIIIDSNSRFSSKNKYWLYLPHDKYGWNKFEGYIKDTSIGRCIYYKGRRVINLKDIEHCDRGLQTYKGQSYHWYYVFISENNLSEKDKTYFNGHYLENTILYFNYKKMTNAHIHFEIIN